MADSLRVAAISGSGSSGSGTVTATAASGTTTVGSGSVTSGASAASSTLGGGLAGTNGTMGAAGASGAGASGAGASGAGASGGSAGSQTKTGLNGGVITTTDGSGKTIVSTVSLLGQFPLWTSTDEWIQDVWHGYQHLWNGRSHYIRWIWECSNDDWRVRWRDRDRKHEKWQWC